MSISSPSNHDLENQPYSAESLQKNDVVGADAGTGNNAAEKPVYGENWDESNLETLSDWVNIGALQIETLDLAIFRYRSIIRQNVLMGLILSTASGSISITQLSSVKQTFVLNLFFTIMSFSIAIFTGLVKIYQIQERLEEYIQLKQEWITFCVNIASEIQLPVSQRRDALKLIKDYKGKYLDLLKIDVDISRRIKEEALENLYDDTKIQHIKEKRQYQKLKYEIMNNCYDEIDRYTKMSSLNDIDTETDMSNCFGNYCKKKFDGRKTSLSNILLTIVLEEEKSERDKNIPELLRIKMENKKNEQKSKKYELHLPEIENHFIED